MFCNDEDYILDNMQSRERTRGDHFKPLHFFTSQSFQTATTTVEQIDSGTVHVIE